MKINERLAPILIKWYRELQFPAEYDADFEEYLNTVAVDENATPETYEETTGPENFLTYLYFCEQLKDRYEAKGISSAILYDTLQEFYRWTISRSKQAGKLHFENGWWVKRTMTMKLFRLGRLNFCMGAELHDVPAYGLSQGDPIIEVHIPREPALLREDCLASFSQSRTFFATYFPDFAWKEYTCLSWLLDSELKNLLSSESNILQFQDLFDVVSEDAADALLPMVFGRGVTRENIAECECKTSLARKVRDRMLAGVDFHESYGILKREYIEG